LKIGIFNIFDISLIEAIWNVSLPNGAASECRPSSKVVNLNPKEYFLDNFEKSDGRDPQLLVQFDWNFITVA